MRSTDDEFARRCREMLRQLGVVLTSDEELAIEIADFGLGDFASQGLALLTYVNTDRYCAKELMLLPGQTCPQHRHPPQGGRPGKQETFRCRMGSVRLFVEGRGTSGSSVQLPAGSDEWYSVRSEIRLSPGEQHTIPPDTWHWFQAGDDGAVVSEFSSTSHDESDVFFDPRVTRMPVPDLA